MTERKLWLWKNGDHFLAYEHLYPCQPDGGDPLVLGEPVGYALLKPSSPPATGPHAENVQASNRAGKADSPSLSPGLRREVVDTIAYIREMSAKAPCLNLSMVRLVNLVDALEAALSAPVEARADASSISEDGNAPSPAATDRSAS